MQPGTAQIDRGQFLFSRGGAQALGTAAVLSVGAVILLHCHLTSDTFGALDRRVLLIAGVATAVGYFSLLAGMWWFWLRCDGSSKLNRTVWFAVLLLGFAYGSQIAYYVFVYLPAVVKRMREPLDEAPPLLPAQKGSRPKAIRAFGLALVAGWIAFGLVIAADLAYPVHMYRVLHPIVVQFVLWPVLMMAATIAWMIVVVFRIGMRRAASPPFSKRLKGA